MSSSGHRSISEIASDLRDQIHALIQDTGELRSLGRSEAETALANSLGSTAATLEQLSAELDLAATPTNPRESGHHLLVADDTEVNRVVALSQLERLGHTGETVDDGQQALDRLLTESFDAVLMDWHMPELDGLAAARAYYAHCAERGIEPIPIIMMTASVSDEARRACAEAGTADYLPKPVSLDALRTCLEQWLPGMAAPPVPESTVVDRSMIDQMVEDLGGPEAVAAVIGAFLADADERSAAIQPPADQNRAEARRAAHTLKSTAALLGALPLSVIAKQLEQLFDANKSPDAETLAEFNESLAATRADLGAIQTELEGH